jgi:hypothetical protein
MRYLFAFLRYYPLFAIPLAGVLAELAFFLKRKGAKSHILYWLLTFFLVSTSIAWIVFRGDTESDRWLKKIFGANPPIIQNY